MTAVVPVVVALMAAACLFLWPVLGRNKTIALVAGVLVIGIVGARTVLGMH